MPGRLKDGSYKRQGIDAGMFPEAPVLERQQ
jgi:hypothetical protein